MIGARSPQPGPVPARPNSPVNRPGSPPSGAGSAGSTRRADRRRGRRVVPPAGRRVPVGMGETRPAVSIVVVSYRTANLLPACLDSIHAAADGLSYEVWVVDNASDDGTVEMLRQDYPWIRLIANTAN